MSDPYELHREHDPLSKTPMWALVAGALLVNWREIALIVGLILTIMTPAILMHEGVI